MSRKERLSHPCISAQGVDFIMGGVALFQGIYNVLSIDPIIVADRGVREGILRNLLKKHLTASCDVSWKDRIPPPAA